MWSKAIGQWKKIEQDKARRYSFKWGGGGVLTEVVIFEQRPEGSEGSSHVGIWWREQPPVQRP